MVKDNYPSREWLVPLILIIVGIVVIGVSIPSWIASPKEMFRGMVVEADGMVMNIVILLGILKVADEYLEKRRKINRYLEEIDDFRGWSSEEAGIRILGNIKRLYKLGCKKINLAGCHLINKDLSFLDGQLVLFNGWFAGSNFSHLDLSKTDLSWSTFERATFFNVNLQEASFYEEMKQDLTESLGSHIDGKSKLDDARFVRSDFRGAKILKEQIISVKTLYQCELDSDLLEYVRSNKPSLLEPESD